MNTYEWNCRTVDTYPVLEDKSDVVYNVHYQVTTSADYNGENISTTVIGTQTLNTDSITEFSEFDDLFHEDIISWTKNALGEEKVSSIEKTLDSNLENLITPKTVTKQIIDK